MISYVIIASVLFGTQSVFSASLHCGRSVGYAKIWNGNIQAAYSQSKNSALRNAVETSVGLFVSSKSEINNFNEIQDRIYTFSEGFVNNYVLIGQVMVDSTTVKSQIDACVSLGPIESELRSAKILADELGYPQIGILINNRKCRSDSSMFYELANSLIESGIPSSVINIVNTKNKIKSDQFDIILELSVKIENLSDTPIPYSKKSLRDLGFNSSNVIINIAGSWRDNSEVITHRSFSKKSVSKSFCSIISTIPKDEQQKIARNVTNDLLHNWNQRFQNGHQIRVTAQLPSNRIFQFQSILEKTIEIQDPLKHLTYIDGTSKFELITNCSARELARRLINISETRNDTLEFNEITFNTVSLKWCLNNDHD